MTGNSGGFVFSAPVNFTPGETIQIIVGKGGTGYAPANIGPYYIPPSGDDGLSGYPGGASKLVSTTRGTLLECDGGSGATMLLYNGISDGPILVPGPSGNAYSWGAPYTGSLPNRTADGPYAQPNGPGACGPDKYGVGNSGSAGFSANPNTALSSGTFQGAATPFGYGSGGSVNVSGCMVSPTQLGTCVMPSSGRDGVVMIDVLY